MAVFLFVVFCMFFCHFGGSNLCGNTKMILNGTLGNSLVLYKLNSNPNYAMLYLKYTNYTSKKKLLEHNFDSSKEDHQSNLNSNYQFKKIDSSVVIQKLQNDDERDYELTVEKKDEFEDVCHIEVKVYEQISSLTVVVTEDSQNNTCRVIMKCLMQTGTNVTFSWMRDEEILSNDGSTLEISITKQNANSTFQCTAKNPVSEKSSQYILSSACNPDHGTSYSSLLLYILVPILISVTVIVVIVLIMKKCKRGMSSKPFGHLQSSPQSRPPAPEPVSEQTNEVTHTLYSTVQKPQIRHVYEAASNSQPFSSVYELAGPCRDDAQSQTIRNEETRV
ncbi:signaling lymphocytic activation molecule-like isoform 1-T1 [Anomaloglossus baeobatrachus]|uniref:signaling lymphocytic activation molecule-like n=1 Tax=Anomaloglossus baeobatrachus TaxID=238106 RepID=UPI003F507143